MNQQIKDIHERFKAEVTQCAKERINKAIEGAGGLLQFVSKVTTSPKDVVGKDEDNQFVIDRTKDLINGLIREMVAVGFNPEASKEYTRKIMEDWFMEAGMEHFITLASEVTREPKN